MTITYDEVEQLVLLHELKDSQSVDVVNFNNTKARWILYREYCQEQKSHIYTEGGPQLSKLSFEDTVDIVAKIGETERHVVVLAHADTAAIGENFILLSEGMNHLLVKNIHKDDLDLLLKRISPYIAGRINSMVELQEYTPEIPEDDGR